MPLDKIVDVSIEIVVHFLNLRSAVTREQLDLSDFYKDEQALRVREDGARGEDVGVVDGDAGELLAFGLQPQGQKH